MAKAIRFVAVIVIAGDLCDDERRTCVVWMLLALLAVTCTEGDATTTSASERCAEASEFAISGKSTTAGRQESLDVARDCMSSSAREQGSTSTEFLRSIDDAVDDAVNDIAVAVCLECDGPSTLTGCRAVGRSCRRENAMGSSAAEPKAVTPSGRLDRALTLGLDTASLLIGSDCR